jgi:hypothetical protein
MPTDKAPVVHAIAALLAESLRLNGGFSLNKEKRMCRNIKTLFNFDPPVTDDEIRAAALQFVRKLSGFNKPSRANEAAFLVAINDVTTASRNLLTSLETAAPPRNREEEVAKARMRYTQRSPA